MKIIWAMVFVSIFISCSHQVIDRKAASTDASLMEELKKGCKYAENIILRATDGELKRVSFAQGESASGWVREGETGLGYQVLLVETWRAYLLKEEKCYLISFDSGVAPSTQINLTSFEQVLLASEQEHQDQDLGEIETSEGSDDIFNQYEKEASKVFEIGESGERIFLAKDKTGYEFVAFIDRNSDGSIYTWYQKHWRRPETLKAAFDQAGIKLNQRKIPQSFEAFNVIRINQKYHFIYRKAGALQSPILLNDGT